MRNVVVAAAAPTRTARKPANQNRFPVMIVTSAPTTKSVSALRIADHTAAVVPELIRNGTSGTNAPNANVTNDDPAALQGDPSSSGSRPSSSRACVSSATSGSRIRAVAQLVATSAGTPFAR